MTFGGENKTEKSPDIGSPARNLEDDPRYKELVREKVRVYDEPHADPAYKHVEQEVTKKFNLDRQQTSNQGQNLDREAYEHFANRNVELANAAFWGKFVSDYPEKAAAYAEKNEYIKKSLESRASQIEEPKQTNADRYSDRLASDEARRQELLRELGVESPVSEAPRTSPESVVESTDSRITSESQNEKELTKQEYEGLEILCRIRPDLVRKVLAEAMNDVSAFKEGEQMVSVVETPATVEVAATEVAPIPPEMATWLKEFSSKAEAGSAETEALGTSVESFAESIAALSKISPEDPAYGEAMAQAAESLSSMSKAFYDAMYSNEEVSEDDITDNQASFSETIKNYLKAGNIPLSIRTYYSGEGFDGNVMTSLNEKYSGRTIKRLHSWVVVNSGGRILKPALVERE